MKWDKEFILKVGELFVQNVYTFDSGTQVALHSSQGQAQRFLRREALVPVVRALQLSGVPFALYEVSGPQVRFTTPETVLVEMPTAAPAKATV